MCKDVYVFAEQRDGNLQKVGIELIGEARKLADDLGQNVVAVLLGNQIKDKASELIAHGADKVVVVDDEMLAEYVTEPYAKAMMEIIQSHNPEIVLYGATSIGRDLAPRVSARIHTGLTADCTKLDIDEETKLLMMTRPAFGGNIMATIVCEDFRPQMATVRPGVMKALEADESRQGEVEVVEYNPGFTPDNKYVEIMDIVKSVTDTVDIMDAKILVSGGRGVGEEGFGMLKELAEVLGGEVSCSRAVVDNGWQPRDIQVGQTGKTVRPNVYFAIGISGAIQHVAGMEESDIIVAINKDETAPIFDVADYGIVGDLNKIVPALTEKLRAVVK